MMNLFEGVRKMTDDEIRMQIALFRNVTLLNAAKETSGAVRIRTQKNSDRKMQGAGAGRIRRAG